MSRKPASPTLHSTIDRADLDRVVATALAEDVGSGDVTSDVLIPDGSRSTARLIAKEPGILAGLPAAEAVFRALSPDVTFTHCLIDGAPLGSGVTLLAEIEGPTRAILAAERTALNLLGRLSGIATLARRYVDAVAGTDVVILDTRKTTPGLRVLEKYAVRCGGATNHRQGLFDAILIKDNHLQAAGGVTASVAAARAAGTGLLIEVEAETLDEVREAVAAGADRILLDNMPLPMLRDAVALVEGRVPLEASGGATLDTVRAIAETGVDFISSGAITHAARSIDVSLEVLS